METLLLVASCLLIFFFVSGAVMLVLSLTNKDKPWHNTVKILGAIGIVLSVLFCCATSTIAALYVLEQQGQSEYIPAPAEPTDFSQEEYSRKPTQTPSPSVLPEPTRRARLGVICEDRGGAKVTVVLSGSPADQAGIREGDVITFVDNKYVPDCASLKEAVSLKAGQEVVITLIRGNETMKVTVILGE